ncbi:MAG: hypothetical protein ACYDCL_04155 [Myxococcales bacterium]
MAASLHWALLAALALAPPPTQAPNGDEVRRLTFQSIREYNVRDFEGSLRDAKQAYALSGLPALLFNLGQCYRALGQWREAEFSYRGYLREKKDAPNRKEVLALIAQMVREQQQSVPQAPRTEASSLAARASPSAETQQQAEAAEPRPLPTPAAAAASGSPAPAAALTEETPPRRRLGPATWWLGGSGAAAVIAGTVLGVLAAGDGGSTKTGANGLLVHDVPAGRYVAGQYEGLSADILWPVGGALIVAAIVVGLAGH